MKYIILYSLFMLLLFSGCMKSVDVAVDVLPDQPNIEGITVGVMNVDGLLNVFPTSLNEFDAANHTAKVYVQTFMAMTNIWASVKLEAGCQIIPLEGAPKFGAYGDFSKTGKYEVRASSGTSAVWTVTIAQDPGMPDISCLANFWTGAGVSCLDIPYPSYSPTKVVTEKVDCKHIKITVDFWQDPKAVITLDLQLDDPDPVTFKGKVTLLSDVSFSTYGYNCKYSKGPAGTYDLNTFELTFNPAFSGYGSSYPLKFKK